MSFLLLDNFHADGAERRRGFKKGSRKPIGFLGKRSRPEAVSFAVCGKTISAGCGDDALRGVGVIANPHVLVAFSQKVTIINP